MSTRRSVYGGVRPGAAGATVVTCVGCGAELAGIAGEPMPAGWRMVIGFDFDDPNRRPVLVFLCSTQCAVRIDARTRGRLEAEAS